MKHLKRVFLLPLIMLVFLGCTEEETVVRNAILIYPNPARETVNVDIIFPKPGTVKLELIGNSNKPLYSTETAQTASFTLDVTSYPNGVYKFIGTQDNGAKSMTTLYIHRP